MLMVTGAVLAITAVIFVVTASPGLAFRFLVMGALTAAVLVPINRLQGDTPLEVLVPAAIVGSALLLVGKLPPHLGGWVLPIALFFLFEAWATGRHPDPAEWQNYTLGVGIAVAGLLLGSIRASERDWERVWWRVALLAAALAVYALSEVWLNTDPLWVGARITDAGSFRLDSALLPGFVRAQGTLGHPLPLASVLLVGVAVVAHRMNRDGITLRRALLGGLLMAGVVASGSRSALLIAFALGLYALARHTIPAILAAVAGLFVAWPTLVEQYDRLVNSGSVFHRLGALNSIQRLSDRVDGRSWIGDGTASTPRLFSTGLLQSDELQAVDNQFVSTLAQNGWIGLLLLGGVVIVAIRRSRDLERVLLLTVVAQFAIFDLLGWPACAVFFWVLVARGLRGGEGSEESPVLGAELTDGGVGLHQREVRLVH